ncbi:putative mitochondrial protein, partial [Mucuna pruriens]
MHTCSVAYLLYLSITCPNINFTMQQVSRFIAPITIAHHPMVIRVLRYTKYYPRQGQGLLFIASSSLQLKAFTPLKCPGQNDVPALLPKPAQSLGRVHLAA